MKEMKMLKYLFTLLALSMGLACAEDDTKGQKIDNSELTGAKWKLAVLVDIQTGESIEPLPKDCSNCYTLEFNSDTTAIGQSVLNELRLIVTPSSIIGLEMTKIWDGENNNVQLLYDALRGTNTYEYSKAELKIYYDDKNKYLS
jgi:hypothetical protein